MTSRWSARALVMTPTVLRMSRSSVMGCNSGLTAMHSMTMASAPHSTARRTMRVCSMMVGRPTRYTSVSDPSGQMMRAIVPVVLAKVRFPPARSPPAINRVTDDLPRVPLTCTRTGTCAR